jgi:hypothetical protein
MEMSVVTKFHMRLNSAYRRSLVSAGYIGPLACSGRALMFSGESNDTYKWSVCRAESSEEAPDRLFDVTIRYGWDTGAISRCVVDGVKISVFLCDNDPEDPLDPDKPLTALSGMSPRGFLDTVLTVEKAANGE